MLRRGDGRSAGGPPRLGRQALALAAIVLLILAASGFLAWTELQRELEAEKETTVVLLRETSAALGAVGDVVDTTATAQALVDEEGEIDEAAFNTFARTFLRQPAISSVAYIPRVMAAARPSFEAQTGFPIIEVDEEGRAVPAGERAVYYPAAFWATSGNPSPGLDMGSDPLRREAILRATTERRPIATQPLQLPTREEVGFMVFTPLFAPPTPSNRGDDLIGLVAVGYMADEIEALLAVQLPGRAGVRVTNRGRVLVERGDVPIDARQAMVIVAGRRWMVAVSPPETASTQGPIAISVVGLLLAIIVAGVGGYLLLQNRRLGVERARTLHLQAATADLATSPTPEAVRRNAVRHVSGILDGAWTGYVNMDERGRLRLLTVSDDREPRPQPPAQFIAEAVESRRPGRTDGAFVFPTGGDPGARDALVAYPSQPPDERDVDLCASLSVVVGAAMRRAAAQELEHGMAVTLQRQALPASIPEVPGWNIAAAYRPALSEAGVGGDWYDVYRPDEQRLVVTVGDIVGHGVSAAGAMGQVRMAVRSLAEVLSPDRILQHLDRMAADISGAAHASIFCMEVDLASNEIRYSSAGLLPPLLLRGETVEFLWQGRGPIVGVQPGRGRRIAIDRLHPGDRLIVYTDGLIETRVGDIDEDLEALTDAALVTRNLDSGAACEAILDKLTGSAEPHDDIALVVATVER